MSRWSWSALVPVLIFGLSFAPGCDGGAAGDSGEDGERGSGSIVLIEIVSPEDGDVFAPGEDVDLEVSATETDGTERSVEAAIWEIDGEDWSADGASVTVDDIPVGEHEIQVTVTIDGREVSDRVDVVIAGGGGGPGDDTGGGGGGNPVPYEGTMSAQVYIGNSSASDDGNCPGGISFMLLGDGSMTGTGYCDTELFGFDYQATFELTGSVSGAQVSGVLYVPDADDDLPFTGTYNGGDGTIQANYDSTFSSGDGTMRIWGSFTATPPAGP